MRTHILFARYKSKPPNYTVHDYNLSVRDRTIGCGILDLNTTYKPNAIHVRKTMTIYNAKTDSIQTNPIPRYTQYGTNLTDETLGSRVIFATDEFFAVADNLLLRNAPEYDPNAYCAQGKVMDGWESRRRRLPGHDWCVLRLAYRGMVVGL